MNTKSFYFLDLPGQNHVFHLTEKHATNIRDHLTQQIEKPSPIRLGHNLTWTPGHYGELKYQTCASSQSIKLNHEERKHLKEVL